MSINLLNTFQFNEYSLYNSVTNLKNIVFDINMLNANNAYRLFYRINANEIHLLNFNTAHIKNIEELFAYSPYLSKITGTTNWNLSCVEEPGIYNVFVNCPNLQSLNLYNWNVSNTSWVGSELSYQSGITDLDASNWIIDNTRVGAVFANSKELKNANFAYWNFCNANRYSLTGFFEGCNSLVNLNVFGWDTQGIISLNRTLKNCQKLSNFDFLLNWDISTVTDLQNTFQDCFNLTSINLSNWNTQSLRNTNCMFFSCQNLSSIDLSNWNTLSLRNCTNMFAYCYNLREIDFTNWNMPNAFSINNMFGCTNNLSINTLKNIANLFLNINIWNAKKNVNSENAAGPFYKCSPNVLLTNETIGSDLVAALIANGWTGFE